MEVTEDRNAGGVVHNLARMGTLAIEHFISQVTARKLGADEDNVTLLVKCRWQDGNTVRGR